MVSICEWFANQRHFRTERLGHVRLRSHAAMRRFLHHCGPVRLLLPAPEMEHKAPYVYTHKLLRIPCLSYSRIIRWHSSGLQNYASDCMALSNLLMVVILPVCCRAYNILS